MLSFNPAVKTRKGEKWYERFVLLLPNYKAVIAEAISKRSRKIPTLRQKVGEAVRAALEKAPAKQMELAGLIASLANQYDCSKQTLYQYIGHLDFVERLPDSKSS